MSRVSYFSRIPPDINVETTPAARPRDAQAWQVGCSGARTRLWSMATRWSRLQMVTESQEGFQILSAACSLCISPRNFAVVLTHVSVVSLGLAEANSFCPEP